MCSDCRAVSGVYFGIDYFTDILAGQTELGGSAAVHGKHIFTGGQWNWDKEIAPHIIHFPAPSLQLSNHNHGLHLDEEISIGFAAGTPSYLILEIYSSFENTCQSPPSPRGLPTISWGYVMALAKKHHDMLIHGSVMSTKTQHGTSLTGQFRCTILMGDWMEKWGQQIHGSNFYFRP